MKKKNILNLIKYYAEKNDAAFRDEAYEIARDFEENGDSQLCDFILSTLVGSNTFTTQSFQMVELKSNYLKKIDYKLPNIVLPHSIQKDVDGVVNAIQRNIGVNKFLFEGAPGTGKTESVKFIANKLNKNLYMVHFNDLIDSHLGQTQKNIDILFEEIANFSQLNNAIILFDEIDAIAIDRINSNDVREMGRATTAVLKALDNLKDEIIIIATTNLYSSFDKALVRRFDAIVNFNRYSREELGDIALVIYNDLLNKFKINGSNVRLVRKIINLYEKIPYPAELLNMIKTSIAFSDLDDDSDYLRNMYFAVTRQNNIDIKELQKLAFTLREIEILAKKSKSQIGRDLKEGENG